MILTESQLQDYIHSVYEGDSNTPDVSNDDYITRRNYINLGIGFWEGWRGTKWNELYTTSLEASTGDKTVATNDAQSDCPVDLVETLGFVQLLDSNNNADTYTFVRQDEAQVYIRSGSGRKIYYITGKPGAYKINWYPKIQEVDNGKTIYYPYYKRALLVTSGSDTPEPSDHLFLVHYTLHWLYKEENPGMSREHLDISVNLINNMKLSNDMEKPYQDRSYFDKLERGFGR